MLACWKQSSEDSGHTGMGHIDTLIAAVLSILCDKEFFLKKKINAKKGIDHD